ncbi:toprim domain-containing protein [Thermococcus sp.]|uniref:toprim domain-containing protein n=1 Tax=Thermococcus sp. TaxID=35749 RepID=UPI0025CDDEA9|nr:toprim domain-containing protein [Thermococcus sp.]
MYAENYKRFLELIDELREFEGALIVEGMRDEVALRNLGVRAEIIRLSRLPLPEVALIASSHGDVKILTDFDRKGEELARKLLRYLAGYPCRVDIETWKELRKLVKKDIKGVEDLYGLYLKVISVSDPRLEGIR